MITGLTRIDFPPGGGYDPADLITNERGTGGKHASGHEEQQMKQDESTIGRAMRAGAADRWTRLGVLLLCAGVWWSCSNSSSGSLNTPVGVAVDSIGLNNYVADAGNNRIVQMTTFLGTDWSTFGTTGNLLGQFISPLGVAVDSNNKIYIADTGNDRIVRIDNMSGSGWTELGTSGNGLKQFSSPDGIAVDSTATPKIYVSDAVNNRIVQMDDITGTNWTAYGTFGIPADGAGHFNGPAGIAVDSGGKIYVADYSNNRIVQMDNITGTNWTSYGSLGNSTGNFSGPSGIAVDSNGKIYVADSGNNRIVQMTNITGAGWTSLGTLGTGINHFDIPAGIAVDMKKYIYVSDQNNNRIVAMFNIAGAGWTGYP